MTEEEIFEEISEEIQELNSSYFDIEITETSYVPSSSDSSLTYANFDQLVKKVKSIETCVLFIDIRKSTKISLRIDPEKMAKLYSSFIRSMIKVIEFGGGKVRNIIGDRIMVVFDKVGCSSKAIQTALYMDKVSEIINRNFNDARFRCGIGIAFGELMVAKVGTIKKGVENAHYKNLIWAGNVANIASKLTDHSNKYVSVDKTREGVSVWLKNDTTNQESRTFLTIDELVSNIEFSYLTPNMRFKNPYFKSFFGTKDHKYDSFTFPSILITDEVVDKLKIEADSSTYLKYCKKLNRQISGIKNELYYIKK